MLQAITGTIRGRMIATMVAMGVVPLLIVGAILSLTSIDHEIEHIRELEAEVTQRARSDFATEVQEAVNELRTIIQNPDLRSSNPQTRSAALGDAIVFRATFDDLALLDSTGLEVARVSRLGTIPFEQLVNRADNEEFIEPLTTGRVYYGPIRFNMLTDEPLMLVAVPTISPLNGEPDGVLVGELRLRSVFERITNIQPAGLDGASLAILDFNNVIVAHRDPELIGQAFALAVNEEGMGASFRGTGDETIQNTSTVQFGDFPVTVVIETPINVVYNAVAEVILTALLPALLGTAILAAVVGTWLANRMVRPVEELAAATKQIGSGDLQRTLAVTRSDELGDLQRDFNQMVTTLNEQQTALALRGDELQASLTQQEALFETVLALSAPLLPVWSEVVVLPVIGQLDARRSNRLLEALLEGVVEQQATTAIIDVTGLANVDDQSMHTLMQATRATQLLGCRVLLAGVTPATALQIVQQGGALRDVRTYRNLRGAIAAAITLQGKPVLPRSRKRAPSSRN